MMQMNAVFFLFVILSFHYFCQLTLTHTHEEMNQFGCERGKLNNHYQHRNTLFMLMTHEHDDQHGYLHHHRSNLIQM